MKERVTRGHDSDNASALPSPALFVSTAPHSMNTSCRVSVSTPQNGASVRNNSSPRGWYELWTHIEPKVCLLFSYSVSSCEHCKQIDLLNFSHQVSYFSLCCQITSCEFILSLNRPISSLELYWKQSKYWISEDITDHIVSSCELLEYLIFNLDSVPDFTMTPLKTNKCNMKHYSNSYFSLVS